MAGKIICPYCFSEHNLAKLKKYCANNKCIYGGIAKESLSEKSICPACGSILKFRCSNWLCENFIEDDELDCNSIPISVIGTYCGGATSFTSVTIKELCKKSNAFGLNIAFKHNDFERNIERLYEYQMSVSITFSRGSTISSAAYAITTPFFVSQNNKRNNKKVMLSIYDSAGSNAGKIELDDNGRILKELSYSKGLIFVFDPLYIPKIKEKVKSQISQCEKFLSDDFNPCNILKRLIATIKSKKGIKDNKKITIPIAIVVNKLDYLKNGILQADNCLLRESKHISIGKYSLKEHDETNRAIKDVFRNVWGGDDAYEFWYMLQENFSTFSFFGCSALGCGVSGSYLKESINPYRVLDPVLWFLSLNNIIKTV